MNCDGWSAQRWARHFTDLFDAANPSNRYRFDVGVLARLASQNFFPSDPIVRVEEENLDRFTGALVPSDSGRRWGIVYSSRQSTRQMRFTVAHAFGHYLLHRGRFPKGIHSDEAGIDGRTAREIEQEANDFAAALLMPLHDFQIRIDPRQQPDFNSFQACADHYDVSLAAAVLRWLRYTERRSMIVVSADGVVKWGWSSTLARKTGRTIRPGARAIALPLGSAVARSEFSEESKAGIEHPAGTWWGWDEPVRELSIRSNKRDLSYTLLHFRDLD